LEKYKHKNKEIKMNDLTLQITKAIEESLPAQTGDILKKRLIKAEADEKRLLELTTQCDEQAGEIKHLNSLYSELKRERDSILERERVLSINERALSERENKIELTCLELKCEKEKVFLVQDMFKTVFQNRQLRESTYYPATKVTEYTPNGGSRCEEPVQVYGSKTKDEQ